jgi:hypothetical protein
MKKDFSEVDRAVLASMDIREITICELDELKMFLPEDAAKGLKPGILLSEINRRKAYELTPAPIELMDHYRLNANELKLKSMRRVLPDLCRKDLQTLKLSLDEIDVIDAALQGFELSDEANQTVKKMLTDSALKMGFISNKKGKRTGAKISSFIRTVAPILLSFGVPSASGGASRLIRILETISEGLTISGDSRWVIRKLRLEAKEDPIFCFVLLESDG